MAAVYTSTNFSTAAEYRRRTISYPFRDDPQLGSLITRYYEVVSGSYSAPVLNTADSEFTTAYCVGVGSVEHVDGELMRYEAKFATIPATRDEHESYAYRFPGWASTFSPSADKTITGFVLSGGRTFATRYCTGHGMSEGGAFRETLQFSLNRSGVISLETFSYQGTVTSANTNSYTADISVPFPRSATHTFLSGSLSSGGGVYLPSRGPITLASHSRIQYDYFLPGVSEYITMPTDIALVQPVTFVGADGNEVDLLTTATKPKSLSYITSIRNKEQMPVESYYRTWMGNIIERVTRWLPYQ